MCGPLSLGGLVEEHTRSDLFHPEKAPLGGVIWVSRGPFSRSSWVIRNTPPPVVVDHLAWRDKAGKQEMESLEVRRRALLCRSVDNNTAV